jgi:hypothetical protein
VKRRGEAYKLIWPQRAEFVRMAAKFGATIVPFAAIGADEIVTTHLNGDELERLQKLLPQPPQLPQLPFDLPFLPRQQKKEELSAEERRARIPRARKGVNAMEEDLEAFMSVSDSNLSGWRFGYQHHPPWYVGMLLTEAHAVTVLRHATPSCFTVFDTLSLCVNFIMIGVAL